MASLKETLISLAEEQDRFGQDSSETRQRIMELDRTEKLQQQTMNPSVLQRAGNFINKLGNIPNVINQNFTGFLNPSPTLDDFSFIKGEQDRIQATLNAQKIADQQADFNRLGLALSLIDGSTSTKPGFNLEPVRDTLNRISQGMMQQRALAPELEFNRRMRPLQLQMAEQDLALKTLENTIPNPVPQVSTPTTRNVTGFDGNLDPNNTGFGFRDSPQNIQSDSQISSQDRVNKFVNNAYNQLAPKYPQGARYNQKLFQKTQTDLSNHDETRVFVDSTLNTILNQSPELYSQITQNDVIRLFQMHGESNNNTEIINKGIQDFRNQLQNRATKGNLTLKKESYFSDSNFSNPSLFSYKKNDLTLKQRGIIQKLNDIYTAYASGVSNFPTEDFQNSIDKLQRNNEDFTLSGFTPNLRDEEIDKLILDNVINPQQKENTQFTDNEPTTTALSQDEDIGETKEDTQQENNLDNISIEDSNIIGEYTNPADINVTINGDKFISTSYNTMRDKAKRLARIKNTTVDKEFGLLEAQYLEDRKLLNQLVPSQTQYVQILDNLLALDDEEWSKVSLPDTNIIGQKFKAAKNIIANPTDLGRLGTLLKQLNSNTFINILKELKLASPTGSTGLGALSNREGKIITDTIGDLGLIFNENDGTISIKQLSTSVIKDTLNTVRDRMRDKIEATKKYMHQGYGVRI